jgi:hypothetical protein
MLWFTASYKAQSSTLRLRPEGRTQSRFFFSLSADLPSLKLWHGKEARK